MRANGMCNNSHAQAGMFVVKYFSIFRGLIFADSKSGEIIRTYTFRILFI